MALAEQLSIDRLRSGASNALARGKTLARVRGGGGGDGARRFPRLRVQRRDVSTVGLLGASAVVVPWLVVVLARGTSDPLGRGRIVADPWSLLAPSWGAWSLTGLLIVAIATLVSWARRRLPAPDVSRTMGVAVVSLLGFAAWCGASVFLWSPSPSGAWRWTVVAVAVLVATVIGLFVGAQAAGRRGVVLGVLLTGTATAAIGLIDLLAFSDGARRVISPLDPTANAVVIGLGVLVAIALDQAEHPQRRRWLRAAATLGIVALMLTASRSGIGVTVLGLFLLAYRGVPIGWPLLQAAGGALPAVVTAMLAGGVAREGLSDDTGRLLVGALVVGGVALVAWNAARDLGAPPFLRRLGQGRGMLVALPVLATLLVIGGAALGQGGIKGTWDRTEEAFSARSTPGVPADATRVWSGTSDGRLWRWQGALDAYQQADDPIFGLGPGAGAQALRRYRREATPGLTVPSAPIAVLTESGAVGLALVLIGVLGLSLAARGELRREPRTDGALLLTIGSVVLVHALFNDDLHQPLILIPAFVAVAALGARQSVEQRLGPAPETNAPPASRTLATVAGTVLAVVVALGAIVPARAQHKARAAEANLIAGNAGALRDAALYSSQASRLDPLAFQGDAIGSQAALALQRWTEARRLALRAVRRGPQEASAWRALAIVALAEHDRPGARTAARKLQELDPAAPSTREIALLATLDSAPPEASPSAVATPLSPTAE